MIRISRQQEKELGQALAGTDHILMVRRAGSVFCDDKAWVATADEQFRTLVRDWTVDGVVAASAFLDEMLPTWKAEREAAKAAAKAAEQQAAKAAEQQAAKAAEQVAGDLATARQIDFIMSLIADGRHEEGGFYRGPITRQDVAKMTKREASTYITSLKGAY